MRVTVVNAAGQKAWIKVVVVSELNAVDETGKSNSGERH